MRLKNLFESDDVIDTTENLDDMDLSDALFVLSEMVDDDKLTDKEIEIIEEMFDRLFEEEEDDVTLDDEEDIDEAVIADHGDTHGDRHATFKKTSMSDRLKNRIYQRRYRKNSKVKARAKKRALIAKRCKGKNRSVQLAGPGSSSYVCKLKDRFRSKLMQRVAKRYNR